MRIVAFNFIATTRATRQPVHDESRRLLTLAAAFRHFFPGLFSSPRNDKFYDVTVAKTRVKQ